MYFKRWDNPETSWSIFFHLKEKMIDGVEGCDNVQGFKGDWKSIVYAQTWKHSNSPVGTRATFRDLHINTTAEKVKDWSKYQIVSS